MAIDRILQLKLITDVSQTTKAVSGVRGRLRGAAAEIGSWTKAAGLGVVIAGIDAVGTALMNGVSDFNEGQKAADRLSRTWSKLGLDAGELAGTMDDIGNRAVSLGFDDTESTDVFNRFLNKTRDAKQSSALLEASWDLARAKGISLADASKIVGKAFDGNKKTLREFGVEGVTGMAAVNAIMVTSKGAATDYADTLSGKLEIIQGVIGEGFEGAAGMAIGAITGLLPTLTSIGNTIAGMWNQAQPFLQQLVDTIGPKLGAAIGSVVALFQALAPHVQNALTIAQPAIAAFGAIVGGVFDTIKGVIDTVTALLNGDFTGAWQGIQAAVGGVVTSVGAAIGGILGTLQNIIPTIGQAALDVGAAIFDGLVDGLAGLGRAITDAVVSGIRAGLNALIDIWNGLALPGFSIRIPAVSIPNPLHGTVLDPVGTPNIQVIGASDFQLWGKLALPNIPRLAAGGIVNPRAGGTLALLGEAGRREAVVPLPASLGNTFNITVNAGPASDPASIGREIVRLIQLYEGRGSAAWRGA